MKVFQENPFDRQPTKKHPDRLYTILCKKATFTPVQELAYNILSITIQDLKLTKHIKGFKRIIDSSASYISAKDRRDAKDFILSKEDYLYSFISCCEILEIDPDYFRSAINEAMSNM